MKPQEKFNKIVVLFKELDTAIQDELIIELQHLQNKKLEEDMWEYDWETSGCSIGDY